MVPFLIRMWYTFYLAYTEIMKRTFVIFSYCAKSIDNRYVIVGFFE